MKKCPAIVKRIKIKPLTRIVVSSFLVKMTPSAFRSVGLGAVFSARRCSTGTGGNDLRVNHAQDQHHSGWYEDLEGGHDLETNEYQGRKFEEKLKTHLGLFLRLFHRVIIPNDDVEYLQAIKNQEKGEYSRTCLLDPPGPVDG